jgi:hypothetical protein
LASIIFLKSEHFQFVVKNLRNVNLWSDQRKMHSWKLVQSLTLLEQYEIRFVIKLDKDKVHNKVKNSIHFYIVLILFWFVTFA